MQQLKKSSKGRNLYINTAQQIVTFFEAFQVAKKRGERILSNRELDPMHHDASLRKIVSDRFGVWSGTIVAYPEANTEVGSEIIYDQLGKQSVFIIPSEFRDRKNCAFVIDHPNYDLILKNDRMVFYPESGKVRILENFPFFEKRTEYYSFDPVTGIPIWTGKSYGEFLSRCLHTGKKFVGPVPRGSNFDLGGAHSKCVFLDVLMPRNSSKGKDVRMSVITTDSTLSRDVSIQQVAKAASRFGYEELRDLHKLIEPTCLVGLSELILAITGTSIEKIVGDGEYQKTLPEGTVNSEEDKIQLAKKSVHTAGLELVHLRSTLKPGSIYYLTELVKILDQSSSVY